jgi:precorrin-4/cobalt-precorrin-4 C11-methyltransferase
VSAGRVLFVGCGPGAADLLTLRAVRALQVADVVVWSSSLIERAAIADHTRSGCEIVEWPPATQHDIDAVYDRALADDLVVVRLKGGDPMLFGAMEPELSAVRERGLGCEVVPGISAAGAGAAALLAEIATPAAPLLLADAAALPHAVDPGSALAVHNAGRDAHALQRDLLALGLVETTPCDVAIEVSRRGEMLIPCALHELAETLEDMGRGVLTLVLVKPSTNVQESADSG